MSISSVMKAASIGLEINGAEMAVADSGIGTMTVDQSLGRGK